MEKERKQKSEGENGELKKELVGRREEKKKEVGVGRKGVWEKKKLTIGVGFVSVGFRG